MCVQPQLVAQLNGNETSNKFHWKFKLINNNFKNFVLYYKLIHENVLHVIHDIVLIIDLLFSLFNIYIPIYMVHVIYFQKKKK